MKIAICDDMPHLCNNIETRLSYEEDMEFVGKAYDGAACIEMVRETQPDVLLLDIQLETEETGIDIIDQLKEISPKTKIVMLTSYNDDAYVFSALINGADDYVIKSTSYDGVIEKARRVYANESALEPDILQKFIKKSKEVANSRQSLLFMYDMIIKLSKSEYEILKDIYNGNTYKEISEKRYVEESTIRTLASRILKKFDFGNMKLLIEQLKELKIFDLMD